MEHRWGKRRPLILPVRLLGPGRLCAIGCLTDISLSGAYVQTLAALAPMSRITIEVARGPSAEPLQLRARVVRQGHGGVGAEWEEFAAGALDEIVETSAQVHRRWIPDTSVSPAP